MIEIKLSFLARLHKCTGGVIAKMSHVSCHASNLVTHPNCKIMINLPS